MISLQKRPLRWVPAALAIGLVAALATVASSCSQEDETIFSFHTLVVTWEDPPPADPVVASLDFHFRSEADPTASTSEKGVAVGRDVAADPYLARVVAGESLTGSVFILVQAYNGSGELIGYWAGKPDISSAEPIDVALRSLKEECDPDGDNIPSCDVAGCCEGMVGSEDCEPDIATANHLVTEITCRDEKDQLFFNKDQNCDGIVDCVDEDGDQWPIPLDCDDGRKTVYPGAPELCDGLDNDCDSTTQSEFKFESCGEGVCKREMNVCVDGQVVECEPDASKATEEVCDNGQDDDCDGVVDNGCNEWLGDWDGDGFVGDDDCNNYDSRFFKGAKHDGPDGCCGLEHSDASPEELVTLCDFDCDGNPEPFCDKDEDGDGVLDGQDCDPSDPGKLFAGAPEKCGDGKDQDCFQGDLSCDEIEDGDQDGYGLIKATGVQQDCDDSDNTVFWGAEELCDGKDNDCDGLVDEGNPTGGGLCQNPKPEQQNGICTSEEFNALYGPDTSANPIALKATRGWKVCAHGLTAPAAPPYAKEQADGADVDLICADFYLPVQSEKACNGFDEDCDGTVDDDFEFQSLKTGSPPVVRAVGESCGFGACSDGVVVCLEDANLPDDLVKAFAEPPVVVCSTWASWMSETDESLSGAPEYYCDGTDNDCDDQVDGHIMALSFTDCAQVGVCLEHSDVAVATCVAGDWDCNFDAVPGFEAQESSCDTLDNDCDAAVDVFVDGPDKGDDCSAKGECGSGKIECTAELGTICSTDIGGSGYEAVAQPDVCNGVDDDCDGVPDNGAGYPQPDKTLVAMGEACQGYGECGSLEGVVECSNAVPGDFVWSADGYTCSSNPDGSDYVPVAETCDNKDNDCDGVVDEGKTYDGVAKGQICDGIGECGGGTVECDLATLTATCSTNPGGSEHVPVAETCNFKDDDCDKETDEGLAWDELWYDEAKTNLIPLNDECTGTGACGDGDKGVTECKADGTVTCSVNSDGSAPASSAEICDGKDNDCNGVIDDDFNVGDSCVGVGECGKVAGVIECNAEGKATCSTNPDGSNHQDKLEKCNTLDDDCNGTVDDVDIQALDPADIDCLLEGVCNKSNVGATCVGGVWLCGYSGVDGYEAAEETCDAKDNDCDGTVDEPKDLVVPAAKECLSAGVCSASGFGATCAGGEWKCFYTTLPGYVADEGNGGPWCDKEDNDCDNKTDEDFPGLTDPCTRGIHTGCQNTGLIDCTADKQAAACNVTGAPQGTDCDDGDLKTFGDVCTGGDNSDCKGTAYECIDDGLDCTVEIHKGDNTCDHELQPGFCILGGLCVPSHETVPTALELTLDPTNECQWCDAALITDQWSKRDPSTSCDDGNSCSDGDTCGADAQCSGTGDINCNVDGLDCTIDDCDNSGAEPVCFLAGIKSSTCHIGGDCFGKLAVNPDNPCQICDPDSSQTAWTARPQTTPCNDGLKCTLNDECTGTGAAVVCTGESNPCDDSKECTADTCQESVALDGCVHTANTGAACTDDGKACTADKCTAAGDCAHTANGAGCFIGDGCVANGTLEPGNTCRKCDQAADPADWSALGVGDDCDDGDECTKLDVCSAAANCAGTPKSPEDCTDDNECTTDICQGTTGCVHINLPNKTPCEGESPTDISCTVDQCQTGVCTHTALEKDTCLIGSECFDEGDTNPGNQCQLCDATAPKVWSNKPDTATICDLDSDGCTVDACKAGICVPTGPAGCTTSDECKNPKCTSLSPTVYSCGTENKSDGTACSTDNVACTIDQCLSGVCDSSAIEATHCYVGSVCHATGAEEGGTNECKTCQPGVSQSDFSPVEDGAACDDDGLTCTVDTCLTGECSHVNPAPQDTCIIKGVCYASGVTNPDKSCEACDPDTSKSKWTLLPDKCKVGNNCYDADESDPNNECKKCDPSTPDFFVNRGTDEPCLGDPVDTNPCTDDKCSGGGNCVHNSLGDGAACDLDSLTCTSQACDVADVCQTTVNVGCVIDNVCVLEGTPDPANPCMACQAAKSTTAYSAIEDFSDCGTCKQCVAGACVNDDTEHGECTGFCQKCSAGACVNAADGEDFNNDCSAEAGCGSGACDGGGACSFEDSGTQCDLCAECDGAGACEPALTRHTDCTNPCEKCVAEGTCGVQADDEDLKNECEVGDGCGTGDCNGAGACGDVANGTECSDKCASCTAGACTVDLTKVSGCNACEKCTAKDTCGFQTDSEDLYDDCTPDTGCGDGNCDGAGGCNVEDSGTQCGVLCARCDGNGSCAEDLTKHDDCVGDCKKCASKGSCGDQDVGEDLKDKCESNSGCGTASCGVGGVCGALVAPGTDCGKCAKCAADQCVEDLTQESDCNTTGTICQQCTGKGTCGPQDAGQDAYNHCGDTGCETGGCDGGTGCQMGVTSGNCYIGSTCVADETADTVNPCQECDVGTSQTAWTPVPALDAKACDDGEDCTDGVCDGSGGCPIGPPSTGSCVIDAACYPDQTPNPANPCEECNVGTSQTAWSPVPVGDAKPCDDGLTCTTSTCDGTSVCPEGTPTAGNCLIASTCYADQDPDLANPCAECDAGTSQTAFSPVPGGDAKACDDGLTCTTSTCDGTFVCPEGSPTAGNCLIASTCYADQDPDLANPCGECDAGTSQTAFSPVPIGDAKPCEDALTCTGTSTCDGTLVCPAGAPTAGNCLIDSTCYADQDPDLTNPCGECASATSQTAFSPVPIGDAKPCEDTLTCTGTSTCDGTLVCPAGAPTAGNCLIDSTCYADQDPDLTNPCGECDVGTSQTAWTPVLVGDSVSCDDGLTCTTSTCDGTLVCPEGAPTAGNCLITSTCYADQTADTVNPCQECDVGTSQTAWSSVPAGDNKTCYTGTPGTELNAPCATGLCDSSACSGEVTPVPEICTNGIDENCDGTPDDGCL